MFIQTHWTSSGNCRDELVVLIDGDDWSGVNWQGILISDWSQTCDNRDLRPISPILANLVMENFELQALNSYSSTPPRLWLRYVDDTFVIINRTEQDNFFEHINSINSHIKFTQEKCLDNKLAFLDCNIKISDTRKLTTAVYRKPTHTDHYLQFGSHHPLVHKLGVIRTLHYRAETVVSDQREVSSEKDHIRGALEHCGYPNWAFEQAKKSNKDTKSSATISPTSETSKRGTLVTIPYCAGLSERVKNAFKSFGISACFKPVNKLRSRLVHVKDKPPRDKQSNLVYGFKCKGLNCSEAYVGETKQSLKARLNQHRRPSSSEYQADSAIFEHSKTSGHQIDTEDVIILDREERWFERGVREAIWERVEKPSLNKRGGLRFQLSHV